MPTVLRGLTFALALCVISSCKKSHNNSSLSSSSSEPTLSGACSFAWACMEYYSPTTAVLSMMTCEKSGLGKAVPNCDAFKANRYCLHVQGRMLVGVAVDPFGNLCTDAEALKSKDEGVARLRQLDASELESRKFSEIVGSEFNDFCAATLTQDVDLGKEMPLLLKGSSFLVENGFSSRVSIYSSKLMRTFDVATQAITSSCPAPVISSPYFRRQTSVKVSTLAGGQMSLMGIKNVGLVCLNSAKAQGFSPAEIEAKCPDIGKDSSLESRYGRLLDCFDEAGKSSNPSGFTKGCFAQTDSFARCMVDKRASAFAEDAAITYCSDPQLGDCAGNLKKVGIAETQGMKACSTSAEVRDCLNRYSFGQYAGENPSDVITQCQASPKFSKCSQIFYENRLVLKTPYADMVSACQGSAVVDYDCSDAVLRLEPPTAANFTSRWAEVKAYCSNVSESKLNCIADNLGGVATLAELKAKCP